jgi:hypothetical protein
MFQDASPFSVLNFDLRICLRFGALYLDFGHGSHFERHAPDFWIQGKYQL